MYIMRPDIWSESINNQEVCVVYKGQSLKIKHNELDTVISKIDDDWDLKDENSLIGEKETHELLSNSVINISRWLDSSLEVENRLVPFATELIHIWSNLDKILAICVANQSEKKLQEKLIKACFHYNRLFIIWNKIIEKLTGESIENLDPLPSTYSVILALEDLSQKDILSFVYLLDLFGTPGDSKMANQISELFLKLTSGKGVENLIGQWKEATERNDHSYASVEVIKHLGYPENGPYGKALSSQMCPILFKDLKRSILSLRTMDDHFRILHLGIDVYYREKKCEFPKRRINWLHF